MQFCSHCGHPVEQRVPEGDNLPRHVCPACNTVHYQNPRIVAGCVVNQGEHILLCRRAIEPRLGLWTVPAGFMELGETVAAAAVRETQEEACAAVADPKLFAVVNVPRIGQVHMMYRAELLNGEFGVGVESLETRLLTEQEIPWQEIAFPSVEFTLRRYFEDLKSGRFGVHSTSLEKALHR